MSEASTRLLKLFEGHRLTPTQRRIAQCLVRRAAEAPFLSSVELARLAGVSQPSVTRFAVALGFAGYPDLRRRLRETLRDAGPAGGADGAARAAGGEGAGAAGEGGEPEPNLYQQAVLAELDNLRQLRDQLADPAPLEEAGRLLAASRPLPVLGLRAAAAQARGFAYFAAKVHPDVRLLDEGGSLLADRVQAAARVGATALLCFALPRHPRETTAALEVARAAGLRVVVLADSAFAPVARPEDVLLPAPVSTALLFDTACAPLLLGRALLQAVCDALPDTDARLEEFDARAAERDVFLD